VFGGANDVKQFLNIKIFNFRGVFENSFLVNEHLQPHEFLCPV